MRLVHLTKHVDGIDIEVYVNPEDISYMEHWTNPDPTQPMVHPCTLICMSDSRHHIVVRQSLNDVARLCVELL